MKTYAKVDIFLNRLAPSKLRFVILYAVLELISMVTAVVSLKHSLWGLLWYIVVVINMVLLSVSLGGYFRKKILRIAP
jgi:hypothetical protein